MQRLLADMARSQDICNRRRLAIPTPVFPEDLPVAARREEIAKALAENQVIVLCGETGSGKTTQLPKICLSIGRGVAGLIGHTQPRRIAARSVANRIAHEMGSSLGELVGYKVRFIDEVSSTTAIKLMTDGILLAEIQRDPYLDAYDTIIIDEAHERSLNIDFLLGYLKRLLPRRPDLKLIITSATIDPDRFSKHFGDCPIILVEGRTYPVEVRYQSLLADNSDDDDDTETPDLPDAIINTIESLQREAPGDSLVFLTGERDIRDLAEELRRRNLPGVDILPLYARLGMEDQSRVFSPGPHRRIVLATNVAETSLTVPRIRHVIDPGLARISRYSPRTKVQRLPIEAISQASADQRKGRCGRVGPGICVRLYGEEDFNARPRYTDPEILRTHLSSVILQMITLGLGAIEDFEFIDPPDYRQIRDGYQSLQELSAIDDKRQVTEIGRKLSRLPCDVRIGRMILAASNENCLEEILILASALSIQDPRHRPMDQQQAADQAHARFRDEQSDFVSLLNIWRYFTDQSRHLSGGALRRLCQKNFLSYLRMREWQDVHRQLQAMSHEIGLDGSRHISGRQGRDGRRDAGERPAGRNQHDDNRDTRRVTGAPGNPSAAVAGAVGGRQNPDARTRFATSSAILANTTVTAEDDGAIGRLKLEGDHYDRLHRAILAGLLGNIGMKAEDREYQGPRNLKFQIFPGSGLYKARPQWIVAAEIVETSRLYARTVGRIQPQWLERIAGHLIHKSHTDAHWEPDRGDVVAWEKVTLFGLPIIARRAVSYGPIDPAASRILFIHHALVEGEWTTKAPFFDHNVKLIEQVRAMEAKVRSRDLLVESQVRYDFYDRRLPGDVYNAITFERWRKNAERLNPRLLYMRQEDLLARDTSGITGPLFPDHLKIGNLSLPLKYQLDLGSESDGIVADLPLDLLNQIPAAPFEWLVPGALREKITELIRSLPKSIRTRLVPAPEFAEAAIARLPDRTTPLLPALAHALAGLAGVPIRADDFEVANLPVHMRMVFRIIDPKGKTVAQGRDLAEIARKLGVQARQAFAAPAAGPNPWHKDNLTRWDFDDLPEQITLTRNGLSLLGYPTLVDAGKSVSLRLMDSQQSAHDALRAGVTRLYLLQSRHDLASAVRAVPAQDRMSLNYSTLGRFEVLREDLITAVAHRALWADNATLPRTRQAFTDLAAAAWRRVPGVAMELADIANKTLIEYQTCLRLLGKPVTQLLAPAVGDMKSQLARLITPHFVLETPAAWLAHLPRYLKAIQARHAKLTNAGLKRDQQQMALVQPLQKQLNDRLARQAAGSAWPVALMNFRWMLEEYRVSLFAQELKTAVPVSPARLQEQWTLLGRG